MRDLELAQRKRVATFHGKSAEASTGALSALETYFAGVKVSAQFVLMPASRWLRSGAMAD